MRRILLVIALLVGGCTAIPEKQFADYTAAFDEVRSVTEQLLLDYDVARKEDARRQAAALPNTGPGRPFPATVVLLAAGGAAGPPDMIAQRREALAVVVRYNEVLTALAAGRKPEEVRETVGGLVEGLQGVGALFKAGFSIPYAGQAAALLSTVIDELEKANNRRQFVDALNKGAPLVGGIIQLLASDAEQYYGLRAARTDLALRDARSAARDLVEQMRLVARECGAPPAALATRLAAAEARVRVAYDKVELRQNSERLPTGAGAACNELTVSQVEQTLGQVELHSTQYMALIDEQQAFLAVIRSYGQMLAQTQASLDAVRSALDAAPDLHAQARQLLVVAFSVRRDFELLQSARRAARSG